MNSHQLGADFLFLPNLLLLMGVLLRPSSKSELSDKKVELPPTEEGEELRAPSSLRLRCAGVPDEWPIVLLEDFGRPWQGRL